MGFSWFLFLLFLTHLAAFAALGLRRRESYYLVLVVTFSLLSGAFGVRIFAPGVAVYGVAVHVLLRYAAWVAAVVSLTLTAKRGIAKHRNAGDTD